MNVVQVLRCGSGTGGVQTFVGTAPRLPIEAITASRATVEIGNNLNLQHSKSSARSNHDRRSPTSNKQRTLPENYQPPHLFLHFDVNETILLGDPAGGDTVRECLNKVIAKSAFVSTISKTSKDERVDDSSANTFRRSPSSGNITENSTHHFRPTHWWNGLPLDPTSVDDDTVKNAPPPPLYMGWTRPTNTCPYYRTYYKSRAKEFTDTEHGKIYRPLYEMFCNKLGLGHDDAQHGFDEDCCNGTRKDEDGMTIFDNFLPAFFHTLQYYFPSKCSSSTAHIAINDADNESINIDWKSHNILPKPEKVTLILRTFGHDLPLVAMAITEFAKGNHPLFPDYCNDDLILTEDDLYCSGWRKACYDDGAADSSDVHSRNDSDTERKRKWIYELHPYYSIHTRNEILHEGNQRKNMDKPADHSGDDEVLNFLQSKTILGIQDHYPFWKSWDHAPWAGKPVWACIDANNYNCHHHHHILLDDNIHNDPNDGAGGIRIPVEDDGIGMEEALVSQYQSLSGNEALEMHGKHLIRVPTVRPLMEEDWFIRHIEEARWNLLMEQQKK
ncbi:LOW QUALITY PROTEIN: hypothetical protein ACHAXS_007246 [Conticribra weissflogii]